MSSLETIFDALREKVGIGERLKTIDFLFSHTECVNEDDWNYSFSGSYDLTIEEAADGRLFLMWPHRNGLATPLHLRSFLGIDSIYSFLEDRIKIFHYLEYVYNMTALVDEHYAEVNREYDRRIILTVLEDVEDAAGSLGMKVVNTDDGRYILCVNDAPVMEAASVAEQDEMACLVEYLHFASGGNLNRKRELLASLYRGFEARREKLKSGGSQKLEKAIGNLANNLNIRHNNKSGSKENPELQRMSDGELESQYDYLAGLYAESILAERRIDKQEEQKGA